MVGKTLQRYRLVEEVGHGGMAVVYRGVDESLEREVAVKLLHPHLAARQEHRRRLAREAKAVARLHRPNILEIYDFSGEDSADAYIVTELIRGRTLRAFASAHPFDPPELAAACVWVIAGALAHAHDQGIVHRDLKPENVMIREDGETPVVKLMDFGIAQIVDRDERMTVTGSLMGSPSHMAPEIIDGEEADVRSDVFSLGTILYALTTGQVPFEGASPGALLKKILLGQYADPRELKPAVSDALAQVIHDALARNRADRIQTARAFQDRLAQALAEVNLNEPEKVLTAFLRRPEEASRELRTRLVRHLLEAGHKAATARRTAKALQAWARVISIVPGTPEAGEARQCIDRLKRRVRSHRALAVVVAGLAVSTALVVGIRHWPDLVPAESTPPVAAPRVGSVTGPDLPEVQGTPPLLTTDPEPPRRLRAKPGGPLKTARPLPSRTLPAATGPSSPGRLAVFVKDVWARVVIDGVHRGQTPFETDVPAGPHLVRLEADCCRPLQFETTLADGERRESRHVLEPLPARLDLHLAGAPDAGIMVDEQFEAYVSDLKGQPLLVHMRRDTDGDWTYDRAVRLRIYQQGFQDRLETVRLRAGSALRIDVTLMPEG